jgi:hypothetical protein
MSLDEMNAICAELNIHDPILKCQIFLL